MNTYLTVEIPNPQPLKPEINLDELKKFAAEISTFESEPIVFLPTTTTVTPHEPILMCYVASIQPHKRFKIYMDWGEYTDIEHTARQGRKVRSEALARQIFPMLTDYEFVSS